MYPLTHDEASTHVQDGLVSVDQVRQHFIITGTAFHIESVS